MSVDFIISLSRGDGPVSSADFNRIKVVLKDAGIRGVLVNNVDVKLFGLRQRPWWRFWA